MAAKKASEPVSLADAVAGGDLRTALIAARDGLVADIEATRRVAPEKTAALWRQLRDVLVQIDELAPPEVSKTDELRMARERRREAEVSAGAKPARKQRGRRGG